MTCMRAVPTSLLFVTGGVFDATEVGEPGCACRSRSRQQRARPRNEVGLPVMARVESTEGVKAALEAGVDTIGARCPDDSRDLELYQAPRARSLRGVRPALPALSAPALPFQRLDPEKTHLTDTQKRRTAKTVFGIIESARAALEAGVMGPGHGLELPVCDAVRHVA